MDSTSGDTGFNLEVPANALLFFSPSHTLSGRNEVKGRLDLVVDPDDEESETEEASWIGDEMSSRPMTSPVALRIRFPWMSNSSGQLGG